MSDDLVSRLKSCAKDCMMLGDEVDAAFFNEAATALTEARAEIERLRGERDDLRFAIFGDDGYDPILKNGNFVEMALATEAGRLGALARAEAAESELSTLRARVREVVGPFARLDISHTDDIDDSALVFENEGGNIVLGHLRAARQLMEEVK